MYEYKKKKLKILLCGSFEPSVKKLEELYKKGEADIKTKLSKKIPLRPMERILHLQQILSSKGHTVILGYRSIEEDMENVFQRVMTRMKEVDFVIILLENYGGVVVEHTLATLITGVPAKTINLVKKDTELSGMLSKGTLLLPRCTSFEYENDSDLLDLAVRVTDTFLAEMYIAQNTPNKEPFDYR